MNNKEISTKVTDLVKICRGNIFCDSRMIAEKFGKDHKNVLQKIDKFKAECLEIDGNLGAGRSATKKNLPTEIFKEKTRVYRGQKFRYYELNRHAFSLVSMSFTGKKALVWRRLFNNAFYLMEQELLRQKDIGRLEARAVFYFKGDNKNLRDDMTESQLKFLAFAEIALEKILVK